MIQYINEVPKGEKQNLGNTILGITIQLQKKILYSKKIHLNSQDTQNRSDTTQSVINVCMFKNNRERIQDHTQ